MVKSWISRTIKMFSFVLSINLLFCMTSTSIENHKTIPKIIFRSHEPSYHQLHERLRLIFNRTLQENTEYCIVYFDAASRLEFIKRFYPEYLEPYIEIRPGAYKSDIFRQMVVYRYSGIYNDLTVNYYTNMTNIIRSTDQFVGVADLNPVCMLNGFFACYTRCPFIGRVLTTVMNNVYFQRYGCSALDITGPCMFGNAFRAYFSDHNFKRKHLISGSYKLKNETVHILRSVVIKGTGGALAVYDFNNTFMFQNKFKGAHDLLYDNSNQRKYYYVCSWRDRSVYEHGAQQLTATSVTRMSSEGVRLKGLEGLLVRNNESSIWYVMNGKRRCFPDHTLLRDLGFDVRCHSSGKILPEVVESIPLGSCFSKNMSVSRPEVESHQYLPNYLESLTRMNRSKLELFIAINKGKVVEYKDFVTSVE